MVTKGKDDDKRGILRTALFCIHYGVRENEVKGLYYSEMYFGC